MKLNRTLKVSVCLIIAGGFGSLAGAAERSGAGVLKVSVGKADLIEVRRGMVKAEDANWAQGLMGEDLHSNDTQAEMDSKLKQGDRLDFAFGTKEFKRRVTSSEETELGHLSMNTLRLKPFLKDSFSKWLNQKDVQDRFKKAFRFGKDVLSEYSSGTSLPLSVVTMDKGMLEELEGIEKKNMDRRISEGLLPEGSALSRFLPRITAKAGGDGGFYGRASVVITDDEADKLAALKFQPGLATDSIVNPIFERMLTRGAEDEKLQMDRVKFYEEEQRRENREKDARREAEKKFRNASVGSSEDSGLVDASSMTAADGLI